MKSFVSEFKAFAVRGNVVDLAVAVIIGTAFGKIVSSLVDTIFTPLIGIFFGGVDFTGLEFTVGEATIAYGKFIQSIFDFVIIALIVFTVVKILMRVHAQKDQSAMPAEPSEEVLLLREIRDSLRK